MKNILFISILFTLIILIVCLSKNRVEESFVSRSKLINKDMKDIKAQINNRSGILNSDIIDPLNNDFTLPVLPKLPNPLADFDLNKVKNDKDETFNEKINITNFGTSRKNSEIDNSVDLSKYILKTEIPKYQKNIDMDKYILKTNIPDCPKQPDMTRYVLKTSIKSCPTCPDMSQYVKKTSIPPPKKCPECNHKSIIEKYKKDEALKKNAKLQEKQKTILPDEVESYVEDALPEAKDVILPDEVGSYVDETLPKAKNVKLPNKKALTLPKEKAVKLPKEKAVTLPKEKAVKLPKEKAVKLPDEVGSYIDTRKPKVTRPKVTSIGRMPVKDVSDNIYKRDADKFIGQPGKPQTVEQAEIVNTFVNNRDQYNPRDIPPQVTQPKIINKQYKNEFNLDLGKTSAGKKLEPYDISNTCNIYKRVNKNAKVLGPY